MNVKQALKKKKKLIAKIAEEFNKVQLYNSMEVGGHRDYSAESALSSYISLTNQLIALKTAIHKANVPVYDKIFRLSELKSMVKSLKNINCKSGKVTNRYESNEPTIYEVEISLVDRDNIIQGFEEEIENLQDELDYHNEVTEINL